MRGFGVTALSAVKLKAAPPGAAQIGSGLMTIRGGGWKVSRKLGLTKA